MIDQPQRDTMDRPEGVLSTGKKHYVRPELAIHGTVEEITALNTSSVHSDISLTGSAVTP